METEIRMITPDLMSVQEAATALDKPRVTIYRWIAARKLLSVKFGGIYYVPVSEVERLRKDAKARALALHYEQVAKTKETSTK